MKSAQPAVTRVYPSPADRPAEWPQQQHGNGTFFGLALDTASVPIHLQAQQLEASTSSGAVALGGSTL